MDCSSSQRMAVHLHRVTSFHRGLPMAILLPSLEADRRIRRAPWFALAGLILVVVSVVAFRDVGFVTGLMLFLSSGAVMGFRPWLRERGLWMLAALSLAVFLALAVAVEYDTLKQSWN